MASKLINIRWIITGSEPYLEMYCIELQTIFQGYIQIKIIKFKQVLIARALGPSGLPKLIHQSYIILYLRIFGNDNFILLKN